MTSLCGIVRNKERLEAANEVLEALKKEINRFYWNYNLNKDFLEVRNIIEVALVIVRSSLAREETRACHFREDYPKQEDNKYLKLTFVNKYGEVKFEEINE